MLWMWGRRLKPPTTLPEPKSVWSIVWGYVGAAARNHYSGYVGGILPCHCNFYMRARRNIVCGDPRFTRRVVTAWCGAKCHWLGKFHGREFLKEFCNVERLQMLTQESYLTAEDWMKQLLSRLHTWPMVVSKHGGTWANEQRINSYWAGGYSE